MTERHILWDMISAHDADSKQKDLHGLETSAVIMHGPRSIGLDSLALKAPVAGDVVVEISHSGISTGTEKLFWSGEMPPFPGMGYPLVPGYEAMGEISPRLIPGLGLKAPYWPLRPQRATRWRVWIKKFQI